MAPWLSTWAGWRKARGGQTRRRAWITLGEHAAIDEVIVNASGCGTMMKDYERVFQHDSRYRERARLIASCTVDVCGFIDRIGMRPATIATNFKVAYHDACSLRSAQRVTREPRRLLRAAGFHVVDVAEAHFCGGSGAPTICCNPRSRATWASARHATPRLAGPVLALGNVGCLAQSSQYTTLPIVHTVELNEWATGGPLPPNLKGRPLRAQPEELSAMPQETDAVGLW